MKQITLIGIGIGAGVGVLLFIVIVFLSIRIWKRKKIRNIEREMEEVISTTSSWTENFFKYSEEKKEFKLTVSSEKFVVETVDCAVQFYRRFFINSKRKWNRVLTTSGVGRYTTDHVPEKSEDDLCFMVKLYDSFETRLASCYILTLVESKSVKITPGSLKCYLKVRIATKDNQERMVYSGILFSTFETRIPTGGRVIIITHLSEYSTTFPSQSVTDASNISDRDLITMVSKEIASVPLLLNQSSDLYFDRSFEFYILLKPTTMLFANQSDEILFVKSMGQKAEMPNTYRLLGRTFSPELRFFNCNFTMHLKTKNSKVLININVKRLGEVKVTRGDLEHNDVHALMILYNNQSMKCKYSTWLDRTSELFYKHQQTSLGILRLFVFETKTSNVDKF